MKRIKFVRLIFFPFSTNLIFKYYRCSFPHEQHIKNICRCRCPTDDIILIKTSPLHEYSKNVVKVRLEQQVEHHLHNRLSIDAK